MIIGVPREIKTAEARVALVPSGVAAFVSHGHRVLVESGAGIGSGIADEAYRAAGATLVEGPGPVWRDADMVIKVKEPLGPELAALRPGLILYTYLHLASNEALTWHMMEAWVYFVSKAGRNEGTILEYNRKQEVLDRRLDQLNLL